MLVALLFFLLAISSPPKIARAEYIPLSYQLLMAFRPSSLFYSAPTPTPAKTQKPVTIALFGDSMIDTLGPGAPVLQKAITNFFTDTKFNILNYGYGASTIEGALSRIGSEYNYQGIIFPSLLGQKPDILVVESFAYNNFGNTPLGLDRQTAALTKILDLVHRQSPSTKVIIAATIAPNSNIIGNGIPGIHYTADEKKEKAATIRLYLENAIFFATSNSLPLANTYKPSLSADNGNKTYISSTDHLHPSPAGAQLFAAVIAKTIVDNNLIK